MDETFITPGSKLSPLIKCIKHNVLRVAEKCCSTSIRHDLIDVFVHGS